MKDYYLSKIRDIFTYTSRRWHYVLFKTLCVIVGAPLFFVLLPLDLLVVFIYALFSWIPVLSIVFLVLCKTLTIVFGAGYYISVLPDARKFVYIHRARKQAEQDMLAECGEENRNETGEGE